MVKALLSEDGDNAEVVNRAFAEAICPLYVIRRDAEFREFFQIDEHEQPAVVAPAVSFMSLAKKILDS